MDAFNKTMSSKALEAVQKLCSEKEVKLLYCCESGSRAWGFESKTSDYDVRFVYTHPLEWYLRINFELLPTQISLMDNELDLVGWDVKKYLSLMCKSNPSAVEWAFCPEYYRDSLFIPRTLAESYFNAHSLACHYVGLATKCYTTYIENRKEVQYKKYLYLVRSLLCYLLCASGSSPCNLCTPFITLCEQYLPQDVKQSVKAIVQVRSNSDEKFVGPCVPLVNSWACSEILKSSKVISCIPCRENPSFDFADSQLLKVLCH